LKKQRDLSREELSQKMVRSDEGAIYSDEPLEIELATIETMVATPGDTQNGVPLSEVEKQNIKVQKAYIGSCTHGTVEDLRQTAEVLFGRKVAKGVKLYVQASSIGNLAEAETMGYIQICKDAGAKILTTIGCGACINAGPGSVEKGEIGIFATNRNFAGRTGDGDTYLANAAVTAASAVAGRICGPDSLEPVALFSFV
jgi:homoaconitate hydratase